jgi:hypothetical protein
MLDRRTPNIFGTSPYGAGAPDREPVTLELDYEPELLWEPDLPRRSSRHFAALRDQLAAGIPWWLSRVRSRRRLWPVAVLLPVVLLLTHHPAGRSRSASAPVTVRSPVQVPALVRRRTDARAPQPQAHSDRLRLHIRQSGVRNHPAAAPTPRGLTSDAGRVAASSTSSLAPLTTFRPANSGPPPSRPSPPGRTGDAEFGFER